MKYPKRIGSWLVSSYDLFIQFHERVVLNQIKKMDLNNGHNQLPIVVGILIFDQVEVLDVAGPFEVFSVARLNEERRQIEPSPFRVLLLGENRIRSWQLAVYALFLM